MLEATHSGPAPAADATVMTPAQLLAHWQGHRRLTRRVIEAFPAEQLFTYRVGEMRPFGEIALELLAMAAPMAEGLASGEWGEYRPSEARDRDAVLREWDESTARIDAAWSRLDPARFQEKLTAFGQYTGPGHDLLLYVIDNEIHHRGQGYVYLRGLGVEPPPFWER
jgi:uncharacterized damage-inducible protein DinB